MTSPRKGKKEAETHVPHIHTHTRAGLVFERKILLLPLFPFFCPQFDCFRAVVNFMQRPHARCLVWGGGEEKKRSKVFITFVEKKEKKERNLFSFFHCEIKRLSEDGRRRKVTKQWQKIRRLGFRFFQTF